LWPSLNNRNQIEQLAEVNARRAAQRQAEAIEGQEILARAMAEVEEDKQKALERKNWHRQNNMGEYYQRSNDDVNRKGGVS